MTYDDRQRLEEKLGVNKVRIVGNYEHYMKAAKEKDLEKLKILERSILIQYSIGKIKTFEQLLKASAITQTLSQEEKETKLTFNFVKEFFAKRREDLTKLRDELEPTFIPVQTEKIINWDEIDGEKAVLRTFQKKAVVNLLEGYLK